LLNNGFIYLFEVYIKSVEMRSSFCENYIVFWCEYFVLQTLLEVAYKAKKLLKKIFMTQTLVSLKAIFICFYKSLDQWSSS